MSNPQADAVHRHVTGQEPISGGQRWWQRPVPMGSTLWLIAVNVVVWAAVTISGGRQGALVFRLALLPRGLCTDGSFYHPLIHDQVTCVSYGSTWVSGIDDGAFWQVLTNAFVHVSPLHLATNMVALLLLGPLVESRLGRQRFMAVYLLSALAASAAICWFSAQESSTVGASGAICGLAMTQVVLSWRSRQYASLALGIAITAIVLFYVRDSHTSWQSHLGGGLGGLAAGAVLSTPRTRHRLGLAGLGVVLAIAIAIRAISLQ